ncbi:MAG: ABC transporter permease [Acidobacteriota bacterium]
MDWKESLNFGLHELKAYKLRSLLTILGIVFGVAAVIAMVSISEGARREALREISLLGMRSIRIRPVELTGGALLRARQKGAMGLEIEDVEGLRSQVPGVGAVAAIRTVKEKVRKGDRYCDAAVVGTTAPYTDAVSFQVAAGRFLNAADEESAARVCVLGSKARRELFPFSDAINESITIGDVEMVVVGVMEEKSLQGARKSILDVRDINRDVYIPLRTAMRRFATPPDRTHELDEIALRMDEGARLQTSAQLVTRALQVAHKDTPDFEVVIPEELLRQAQKSQRIFNVVMGAIAGISLVVGGIGIMNIMLATVTQRTREIGIRRALGARRQDLLLQFLLESILLSLAGGVFGIALGIASGFFIARYAQWVTVISVQAIAIAVFVSTATGVIFGFMPARRASDLDPIEALRHE